MFLRLWKKRAFSWFRRSRRGCFGRLRIQGRFFRLSVDRENRFPDIRGHFRGLSWPTRIGFPGLREDRFLRFNKKGRLPEIRGTTTGTFLGLREIKRSRSFPLIGRKLPKLWRP